jgi:FkbM family methyltransferase
MVNNEAVMPEWIVKTRLRQLVNIGLWQAAFYALQRTRVQLLGVSEPYTLFCRFSRHGLRCRPMTSDINVFTQIFITREYQCLDEVQEPSLIMDCGANVGYSSAYFLSRFPKASLIAVEPDPKNFVMLLNNIQPFGERATAICCGVWSREVGLVFSEEPFGDGREWARTVRAASDGEKPDVMAKGIETLLNESGFERISILKVDIEGSEADVFGSNYEPWIGKVDHLVIEIHGDKCGEIFSEAIAKAGRIESAVPVRPNGNVSAKATLPIFDSRAHYITSR